MVAFYLLNPVSFFILAIIFVVIVIIFAYISDKKRSEAIQKQAMMLGFSFEKTPSNYDVGNFQVYNSGWSSKIKNYSYGKRNGYPIKIFDFIYTTNHGKSNKQNNCKCAVVTIENSLPVFVLRLENFITKFIGKIGFPDINFPEYPVFSNKYNLKGKETESIKKTFTGNIIKKLEQLNMTYNIEANGKNILIYQLNHSLKPEDINTLIIDAISVAKIFDSSISSVN